MRHDANYNRQIFSRQHNNVGHVIRVGTLGTT